MEALWNLEDKWKLSTRKAVAVFACTCVLVIGMCVVAAFLRKKSRTQEPVYRRWCSVKKVLMGSVRWSEPSKWEEGVMRPGSERDTPTPLLVTKDAWHSHNSSSAVWQRPILMGEKCEMPRFSGLILYDQKGKPRHECDQDGITINIQDIKADVVRTRLRDFL